MNTPAHLIFAAAAFGKPDVRRVTIAALIGGFLPDLSLYLLAGYSMFILDITPQRVFDELYFSDAWQQVFAIDNSFILWGIGLAAALYWRRAWAVALCGGALLHLAFDFPLHSEDARMHFWPLVAKRQNLIIFEGVESSNMTSESFRRIFPRNFPRSVRVCTSLQRMEMLVTKKKKKKHDAMHTASEMCSQLPELLASVFSVHDHVFNSPPLKRSQKRSVCFL